MDHRKHNQQPDPHSHTPCHTVCGPHSPHSMPHPMPHSPHFIAHTHNHTPQHSSHSPHSPHSPQLHPIQHMRSRKTRQAFTCAAKGYVRQLLHPRMRYGGPSGIPAATTAVGSMCACTYLCVCVRPGPARHMLMPPQLLKPVCKSSQGKRPLQLPAQPE